VVTYFDHWFPLAPPTYDAVLSRIPALADLSDAFAALPPATTTDVDARITRHRDKELLKARLAEADVAAVDAALATLTVDDVDALLERQNYRLAYWRAASNELDYRRFFDITSLAALRMEDELVFEDTHALVLQWLVSGVLDGVRVDHPDGLLLPAQYVEWVRERAPDAWVVLEKILESGERLPPWSCDGTTGYDFLNQVTRVLVDPSGESPMTDAYAAFTGEPTDYVEVLHEKKRLVLRETLAADLLRLTNLFVQLCESERRYRDYTRPELHAVLRETLATFGVYRTYVVPGEPPSDDEEHHIAAAIADASARRPDIDAELWTLLGRVLRGEIGEELCLRFQQTSGPVMAKGAEDTAFYTYVRFLALNEVGGDPGRWSDDVDSFHREMQRAWPASMLASSTHDTKRSEDVRARLLVLAEIPDRFADAVAAWAKTNERHWGTHEPDRNLEWYLYQTLVGAHPLSPERAHEHLTKAMREAKVHTAWTAVHEGYEAAVHTFLDGILADDAFTAELDAFVAPLVEPGRVNALAMQALKLTAPGVPDVYQGTELWDLSLVDPDNRRPVDYDERRRLLRDATHPKLRLTTAALHLDIDGAYEPLAVEGVAAEHALAFSRGGRVAVVVPRLPLRLTERGGFGDTVVTLPDGVWTDVVTGATVHGGAFPLAQLLRSFPVSLLVREGSR
jgi:(1->4)-alpha-D-glucan 1-alpha-D-glucosylmutase